MLVELSSVVEVVFGNLETSGGLQILEIAAKAIALYGIALVVIRMAKRRLLGRNSDFDIILAIILGSLFSRAINGKAPFLPTIAASLVLVFMHWLLGRITLRHRGFEKVLKGSPTELIRNREVQKERLNRSDMTENDLLSEVRITGRVSSLDNVELAVLEPNGKVSVLPAKPEPKVIEIEVKEGVQVVRLEIG